MATPIGCGAIYEHSPDRAQELRPSPVSTITRANSWTSSALSEKVAREKTGEADESSLSFALVSWMPRAIGDVGMVFLKVEGHVRIIETPMLSRETVIDLLFVG